MSQPEVLGRLPKKHVGRNGRPQHTRNNEEELEIEFDVGQKGRPQDRRPGLCHDENREGIGQ